MASESEPKNWGLAGLPRAAAGVLGQMFRAPARFEPAVEAEFRREGEARAAPARQAGLILLLLIWVSYFGWDSFHAYRNQDFRPALDIVIELRLAGTVCIVATGVALMLWRARDAVAVTALSLCFGALYLLSLGMIAVTAFPYNYLFYFICLPLILLFMFGLIRMESRVVYTLTAFCLAASFVFLIFTQTTEGSSPKNLAEFLAKSLSYYNVAALMFLASFSLIGCAVSVDLERTGRESFARERQLIEKNARLAASRRDIRERTSALVKAKDELRSLAERQNVAKSRFLADAAHDLRQPMQALTNLLGATRHALETGDSGKAGDLLAMAQDASRLTRASLNAVLDISRLESGFVEAEYSTFDLAELVEEAIAPFAASADERGVEIRRRWRAAGRILVRSDRHLLGRVVGNLVSNAVKYADPLKAGRCGVVVGIVCLPSRVRIDIFDNGVGIAEADWPKVFSPFVQLGNPERDREKGVGLGLSIVNAIVTLLDEHRLDMGSWQGRGTRFSLELPYGDEALETALRVEVSRPPGGFDLSGLYAFYVEDDPLVRRSTVSLFEALGMRFEAFASLAELEAALPEIEREPDLLVSDYRLPEGRTARDVLAAVESAFGEAPPCLVVTGEMGALGGGRWPGPTAILRKPVTPEALVREISALSVRRAEAAEPLSPAETPRSAAPSAEPL